MAVQKPPVVWVGTHGQNIWRGAGTHPKYAIVLHVMAGTLAGCDSWFSDPRAQASANFGIGDGTDGFADGEIHCYVDPDGNDAPYANGALNEPDAQVVAYMELTGGVNPNYTTISIEHAGYSHGANNYVMSEAQLEASAQLAAYYIERNGIPNEDGRQLGHYQFDSVTRLYCPGMDNAQWQRWQAAVTRHLTGAPAVPPAGENPCAAQEAELAQIKTDEASTRNRLQGVYDELLRQAESVRLAIEGITH